MFLTNMISNIGSVISLKNVSVALISIIILYGVYDYGVTTTNAQWLSKQATQYEMDIKQQEFDAQQYKWADNFIKLAAQNVNTELEQQEKIDNELDKNISQVKQRPVYNNDCFDVDGLRYINGG